MVTSALKIGTEGTGGGRGCFVEGEQEGLSGRETLEQPTVCPTWGPPLHRQSDCRASRGERAGV